METLTDAIVGGGLHTASSISSSSSSSSSMAFAGSQQESLDESASFDLLPMQQLCKAFSKVSIFTCLLLYVQIAKSTGELTLKTKM